MSLMLCVSDNCHQCARSNNGSEKNQNGIDKEGEMHHVAQVEARAWLPSTVRASLLDAQV